MTLEGSDKEYLSHIQNRKLAASQIFMSTVVTFLISFLKNSIKRANSGTKSTLSRKVLVSGL